VADAGSWKGRTIPTKDAAKDALGLAGKTVILRTDRYIFRKNYPAFFRVIRPVLEAHPEVAAVIHTVLSDDEGRGDIRESLSREPGAVPVGPVDWTHPQIHLTRMHDSFRGLSDGELRVLYNAADLYVSPTMAEGFGLCQAEALACGVPVVTTNYSAIPEVVGPGGVLIPPAYYLTNAYAHEWALVDEPAMTAAIEHLIAKPAKRRELGTLGRQHVARFTWSRAVEVFDRLLTQPAAVAA
jgi:glycosyltransferase involved in cell wall biosynthesis